MILNEKQIEEIRHLIVIGDSSVAIQKLVEYSECEEYDARCLVEDFDLNPNMEYLLNKHWIEKRTDMSYVDEKLPKLSKKEIRSLIKIFLPTIFILFITIFLIVSGGNI